MVKRLFSWIENPCVGGSIPPQATKIQSQLLSVGFVVSDAVKCVESFFTFL